MNYTKSPFKPSPTLLISGKPEYLWGGYNDRTSPTRGVVLSDSVDSFNNASVTFLLVDGNIPVVGSLITVVGSANSSGAFNVTNSVITYVSSVLLTGVVTVIFSLAASAQANAADVGQVMIPQPETAEALPTTLTASVPAAFAFLGNRLEQGRVLTAVVSFPVLTANAAFVVGLQEALQDIDSEYYTIGTVATVIAGAISPAGSSPAASVAGTAGRFYRFIVASAIAGTVASGNPANVSTTTIVAKLMA